MLIQANMTLLSDVGNSAKNDRSTIEEVFSVNPRDFIDVLGVQVIRSPIWAYCPA